MKNRQNQATSIWWVDCVQKGAKQRGEEHKRLPKPKTDREIAGLLHAKPMAELFAIRTQSSSGGKRRKAITIQP